MRRVGREAAGRDHPGRAVSERQFGAEPRVRATAVQTVGSKGYDGFLLARVIS